MHLSRISPPPLMLLTIKMTQLSLSTINLPTRIVMVHCTLCRSVPTIEVLNLTPPPPPNPNNSAPQLQLQHCFHPQNLTYVRVGIDLHKVRCTIPVQFGRLVALSNREQRGEKATWWQWRVVALSSGGKGRERKRERERETN